MQNNYSPNNYQPQPPIGSASPIQLLLSKMQSRTQFLCWIQIFLKAVFLLFLFLDGMFSLEYHKHVYVSDDYTVPQSFSTVATEDCYIPGTEWYLRNEFCHVLFYIIIVVIAVDLVLSIQRAIKPEYTKKWKWQLALPAFIFVAVITSVIISSSYCDTGKILGLYRSSTGLTSYYNMADMDFILYSGDYIIEFYGGISINFLFYITLLLGLVILAIDFYTMFMSNQKSFDSSSSTLKQKSLKVSSFASNTSVKVNVICPVCGKHFKDREVFCDVCGNKLVQPQPQHKTQSEPLSNTIQCPKCGNKCDANSSFCDNCGNNLVRQKLNLAFKVCPVCSCICNSDSEFCNDCGCRLR